MLQRDKDLESSEGALRTLGGVTDSRRELESVETPQFDVRWLEHLYSLIGHCTALIAQGGSLQCARLSGRIEISVIHQAGLVRI